MMADDDPTPRSAFVTGAGSGIGRAVAIALARSGYGVGVFDVDADGAEATVAAIAAGGGPPCIALPGDVTSPDEVAAAVRCTVDALGPLTAAVANAGIWAPGDALAVAEDVWHRALAINATGTFHTARAAVTAMLEHGRGGSLVGIASDVGVHGSQGCAAYVASKHAVVGLFRTLALDFGPRGIRSNVVCPGFVETPLADEVFRGASDELLETRRAEIPLGRFARPQEVADMVAYLVAERSSFVNGAVLLCDGGATTGYFHTTGAGGRPGR